MTTTATPPQPTMLGPQQVKRTPWWAKALLVLFVLLLVASAAFAGLTVGKVLGTAESRDTQVIRSISREEQVILVTAGIADVIFLGYENPEVSVAKDENGLLSWTTPEIDTFEIVEEVLTDEAVATHIDGFRPVLEEQARSFYSSIVTSIDPDVTLEFEFTR